MVTTTLSDTLTVPEIDILFATAFAVIATVFPVGIMTSSVLVGTPLGVQLEATFQLPEVPVYVFVKNKQTVQELI